MAKTEEILLIECLSSGRMYVEEIIERGYKCLLVNPDCSHPHLTEQKEKYAQDFKKMYSPDQIEILNLPNDAQIIYDAVKEHNIVCAVVGSEYGVRVTDQVTKMLGLPHNDPDTTWKRCTKTGMTQALKDAGLRHILSTKVTCEQDIIDFCTNNNLQKCFMKFSESAAGASSKACENMQEAIDHYNSIKDLPNFFGNDEDDILLQEFIEGDEYVVNTVSCQGQHLLTDIWKYTKIKNDEGNVIYQSSKLIEEIDDELKSLLDYVYKTLDAVDIKYGPCHGEFKIDSKGPILIETNCRPMGDSMSRDYMLDILGQCIVDVSLDSFMHPDKVLSKIQSGFVFKPLLHSTKKYVILNKETTGDMASGFYLAEHLKTFHNHNDYEPEGVKTYKKTNDLGDTPIIIKLASTDAKQVSDDVLLMNKIEENYPDMLIMKDNVLPAQQPESIQEIVKKYQTDSKFSLPAGECRRALIITNDEAYEYCNGSACPVNEETPQVFDSLYFADSKQATLKDKFKSIVDSFAYITPKSLVYASPSVLKQLPYGQECFDLLRNFA